MTNKKIYSIGLSLDEWMTLLNMCNIFTKVARGVEDDKLYEKAASYEDLFVKIKTRLEEVGINYLD